MTDLKTTPLHAAHVAAGARLVDFGGWEMPVQYEGAKAEHFAVRDGVGLFDVSHMGEVFLLGSEALKAADHLVTNRVAHLEDGQACYAGLLNEKGGFIDDVVVYRIHSERVMICLNASNAEKDIDWIRRQVGHRVDVVDRCEQTAQIAVQGPKAAQLLQTLTSIKLDDIPTYRFALGDVAGVSATLARTGYTGEDGFELYIPAETAHGLWDQLVAGGGTPCGLGARDSLRLEMKYALYGNDISELTNPIEAGLGWICKDKFKDFIGADAIRRIRSEGVSRKLVGLTLEGRRIARNGTPVHDLSGQKIGSVTSGAYAPSVGASIAMAYLETESANVGTEVHVIIREKAYAATVVKTPFHTKN
jgi:aminomethyltransferase